MIHILVLEDEALIAQRLIRFIQQTSSLPKQIQHFNTLEKATAYLSNHSIDLLFLDLNLNGKHGFDLLKSLVHKHFFTIVVSAYTDKAIEAFEYGVLDFIGKPFTQERLNKAINRFVQTTKSGTGMCSKLGVRSRGKVLFVPVNDIAFFKASGIYSELHTHGGTVYIYDKPLNGLMKILPANYKRIHKSYAVCLNQITAIVRVKHNTYQVKLINGNTLPISRKARSELSQLLNTR